MPDYPLPKATLTTDIVIFTIRDDRLEILLIRRANPPFQGSWALPGGIVEEDEGLDDCTAASWRRRPGFPGSSSSSSTPSAPLAATRAGDSSRSPT